MRLKPLRLLAPIAFGVFLFHVPVIAAVGGFAEGDTARPEAWLDVAMKLSAFAATVALATVSWIFFERRIVAWGRSFRYEGPRVAMTQSDRGSGVATEGHKVSPAPSAGSTKSLQVRPDAPPEW
jgi:peptidoglycan/LPS O-acetylase OafA/YrhL